MSAITRSTGGQGCRRWGPGIAALAIAFGSAAIAQVVSVPTAHLNHTEGSVAYAPQGDQEWHDIQPRRVLKRGDRLWTDRGSRAEVQASGHALRMNGETQLILENVSETATQLSLTQGTVAATVTRVNPGDSFEVGTPNLAFRARQPGDYRIDVDTKQGVTRVVVMSGAGVVYGEKGEALEVHSGQRLTFRGRDLTRMLQPAFAVTDEFDRWTGARKRGEPTVSMPAVAEAPTPPIPNTITKGRTIVISGSAASLKQPAPAKGADTVAPAIAQPAALAQPAAKVMPSSPPTLKVAAPVLPAAASVTPAILPVPGAPQAAAARAQPIPPAQTARDQQRLTQQRADQERQAAALRAEQERQAASARAEQDRRSAAARTEQERRAAAVRLEQEKRTLAAAEAKHAEERRRGVAAKRAEEERRQVAVRLEQEHKRQLALRHAEEEKQKKVALARRAAEEKRLAAERLAARKAEQQRIAAEAMRRQHLARLQEQARREEQSSVVRRAEAARRADDDRRAEQARREEDARREDQGRRDEADRRQRALAEQARREQARRDEEVWLRQQQPPQQIYQPARPQPMGVPARRIS